MSTCNQFISRLFKQTLVRHLGYYLYFCFFTWFFHLLLISLLTFIHLQLGHGLKIIDEWLYQNGWMIISFSQFLSLFVSFQTVSMWSDRRQLLAPLTRQGWVASKRSFITILGFLWLGIIFWGIPEFKLETDIFKNLVAMLGICLFYGVNVFYLGVLNEIFPLSRTQKNLQILIFPIFFWIMAEISFPYRSAWGGEIALILSFSLYLYFWRGENWTHPTLFLVAFASPAGAFLGSDPLWDASFSFGKISNPIKAYEWGILLIIAWVYLVIRRKDYWDFKDFKVALARLRALKEKLRGVR